MAEGTRIFNINGNYIEKQEITVQNGGILQFGGEEKKQKSNTEKDIEVALNEMLELKGENDEYLFSEQGQWYAVYRVLNEVTNYPSSMKDFCRRMKDMGYAECRIKCTYDSVAERQRSLPKLSVKVTLWQDYRNLSDAYEKQCVIAAFLINRLV